MKKLLIILFVLLVTVGSVSAATRYVAVGGADDGNCTTGDECITLAYALTQVSAGETIEVSTNTTETDIPTVADTGITITGTGGVRTIDVQTNGVSFGLFINDYSVTVTNIKFLCDSTATTGTQSGIYWRPTTAGRSLTLTDVEVHGSYSDNIDLTPVAGVAATATLHGVYSHDGGSATTASDAFKFNSGIIATMEDCEAANQTGNAASGASDCLSIHCDNTNAVSVTLSGTTSLHDCTNGISNMGQGTTLTATSGTLTIDDSAGASGAGVKFVAGGSGSASTITITGATISDATADNIQHADDTGTIALTNCTISGAGDDNVANSNAGTITITGGTISGATDMNIYNESTGTITTSGVAISASGGDGVYNNSTGTLTIGTGSILTATGVSAWNNAGGRLDITGTTITGGSDGVFNKAAGPVNLTNCTISAATDDNVVNDLTGTLTITGGSITNAGGNNIQGSVAGGSIVLSGVTVNTAGASENISTNHPLTADSCTFGPGGVNFNILVGANTTLTNCTLSGRVTSVTANSVTLTLNKCYSYTTAGYEAATHFSILANYSGTINANYCKFDGMGISTTRLLHSVSTSASAVINAHGCLFLNGVANNTGIQFNTSNTGSVTNCTFYGTYRGLTIGAVTGITVKNNIFSNIGSYNFYTITPADRSAVVTQNNNLHYGAVTDVTDNAAFKTTVLASVGYINADPKLADPANGVYYLKNGSPCLKKGANLGSTYENGLDKKSTWPSSVITKKQTSPWTIGAFAHKKVCIPGSLILCTLQ